MSNVKWTPEQRDAINTRDRSILVSAGAGSGKTAVLVERIIQRILDVKEDVDIDRLVVVTFTDAAASEMRERIERAITKRINEMSETDPPELRKRLKRQITLLGKASITTIHSFCSKLIRRNFNKLDIEPNFKILDQAEEIIIKNSAVEKVLNNMYEKEEPDSIFEDLVDIYGGARQDQGLRESILNIYNFSNSLPFPEKWINEQADMLLPENLESLKDDFRKTAWGEYLCTVYEREANDMGLEIQSESSWDEISWFIKSGKDYIIDDKKYGVFLKSSEEIFGEISEMYVYIKMICELTLEFSREYTDMKSKRKSLDYNDLEHLALRLLAENKEIADEMTDYYTEIYTDEYQDTNLTQETILSLITKKEPKDGNLFMVGDIKQSIYGFRQARPDLFLYKYYKYSQLGSKEKLIKLHKNFRSRKDIIGSVNYIFHIIMSKEVCGMDYTEEEYLYYGADYKEAVWDVSSELLLFEGKKDIENEGAMIAKRIIQLVNNDPENIQYRDIVVLLRATRGKAEKLKEIFEQYGIPSFCDVNDGFYKTREVRFIISMLQIVDNPIQDIPLLSVLKSPAAEFTDEEIAYIRLVDKDARIFQNIIKISREENCPEKVKCFLELLDQLREDAVEMPLSELILRIYRRTDYFNYAGIFTDGKQRQANLRKLYEEAVRFEEQSGGGIFEFLNYIDKVKESSSDSGGAVLLGENDNVIRIMSIHKSKGLEFPVVFIANMDKTINRSDFAESIIFHQDFGMGIDHFNNRLRVKSEMPSKSVIKIKANYELVAEEIRLLYVAMTRAKEKLIMTGSMNDILKSGIKYWEPLQGRIKLSDSYMLKVRSYFDIVLPVLMRHPSMEELRKKAGIEWTEEDIIATDKNTECSFNFNLCSEDDIIIPSEGDGIQESAGDAGYRKEREHKDIFEFIKKRLEYKYKYEVSTKLPVKISVSDINNPHESTSLKIKRPDFIGGNNERDPVQRGNTVHYIMQHIDLNNISEEEIERLCGNHGILKEEHAKNDIMSIVMNFFETDIGKRLTASPGVYRETPFTMLMNAEDVYEKYFTGGEKADIKEQLLVQGIIDCYFEEDGQIVLLDYKTDRVSKTEAKEHAEKYRTQIEMYARAVENGTDLKIKEKLICFLNINEYVLM